MKREGIRYEVRACAEEDLKTTKILYTSPRLEGARQYWTNSTEPCILVKYVEGIYRVASYEYGISSRIAFEGTYELTEDGSLLPALEEAY